MAKPAPCILVVEDERAVRDLVVAFLKTAGYVVATAGNAEEAAYYILKDKGLDIRLAIVDLMLPNANGLTLIRKLREAKNPRRRALPVIVLTGRTDTETYKAAARRGIHAYLMKPVSCGLLLDTVAKVLGEGAAALRTGPIAAPPPALEEFEKIPSKGSTPGG
ncbi:MAG: response regulator [Rhodospirillaceae bacterium]|nr:response regulator [Rhodospirillaceae bacterium]